MGVIFQLLHDLCITAGVGGYRFEFESGPTAIAHLTREDKSYQLEVSEASAKITRTSGDQKYTRDYTGDSAATEAAIDLMRAVLR